MIDCRYITINLKCSNLRKDLLYLVDGKCCLTFPKRTFCKLQMSIPIEESFQIDFDHFDHLECEYDCTTGDKEFLVDTK